MKNQELFDRTISILVKAYFNDTLQHQYCACCAVGNLVAANMGYSVQKKSNVFSGYITPCWTECTFNGNLKTTDINELSTAAQIQINATGYTPYEIHIIEKAFESVIMNEDRKVLMAYKLNNMDEKWQVNGLMAVCDALMQIHEATPTEIQQAKSLFTKELAV